MKDKLMNSKLVDRKLIKRRHSLGDLANLEDKSLLELKNWVKELIQEFGVQSTLSRISYWDAPYEFFIDHVTPETDKELNSRRSQQLKIKKSAKKRAVVEKAAELKELERLKAKYEP